MLRWFDYEISLSRGSGNEWLSRGDPFAVAARVGSPAERNVVVGLSGFHGEVLARRPRAATVRRTRLGLDAQWLVGPFTLLGETSVGRNNRSDVVNSLAEVNWRSTSDEWLVYVQERLFLQRFSRGWSRADATVVGVRYVPNNHVSLSAQYTHDWTTFGSTPHDSVVSLQARYRF